MAKKNRTNDELQAASNHLHYEYWMLTSIAQSLGTGISGQGWLNNALIESFVIHLRVLIDFFYPESVQNDDVIAADYFNNDAEWNNIRPPMTENLKAWKIRAHKEIAHLTYARLKVTAETKGWPFIEIAESINLVMDIYLKNVLHAKLGHDWKRN